GFTTVDGDIRFRGGVRRAGTLEFDTHRGDVELLLRPDLGATFELSSIQGRIASELGEADGGASGASDPRTRVFETGNGESRVTVRTFSGEIAVREAEPVAATEGSR
ncbi:MAG: DUF4097 family beta strand repeat-containing protein, partial [Gemmatimonadota bacterium]